MVLTGPVVFTGYVLAVTDPLLVHITADATLIFVGAWSLNKIFFAVGVGVLVAVGVEVAVVVLVFAGFVVLVAVGVGVGVGVAVGALKSSLKMTSTL